jgi:hypothetical protein
MPNTTFQQRETIVPLTQAPATHTQNTQPYGFHPTLASQLLGNSTAAACTAENCTMQPGAALLPLLPPHCCHSRRLPLPLLPLLPRA